MFDSTSSHAGPPKWVVVLVAILGAVICAFVVLIGIASFEVTYALPDGQVGHDTRDGAGLAIVAGAAGSLVCLGVLVRSLVSATARPLVLLAVVGVCVLAAVAATAWFSLAPMGVY